LRPELQAAAIGFFIRDGGQTTAKSDTKKASNCEIGVELCLIGPCVVVMGTRSPSQIVASFCDSAAKAQVAGFENRQHQMEIKLRDVWSARNAAATGEGRPECVALLR
jgi:hypothetical protein